MAAKHEAIPTPNLAGYAFGEKLGAGSYGEKFQSYKISIEF